MSESPHSVRVQEIDWTTLLPITRIFRSFRMAIHPPKLVVALMMVVLLYGSGRLLDVAWGPQVLPNEIAEYRVQPLDGYHQWREANSEVAAESRRPIFATLLNYKLARLNTLAASAASLDFGLEGLINERYRRDTVVGAVRDLFVLPGWMWQTHRVFFLISAIITLLLWAVFGGTISRMAALESARDHPISTIESVRFAVGRFVWFALTPVVPLLVVAGVAVALALGGLVFFNLPGLDIVGGLLFILALVGGLVIALILIGLALAIHLIYPAIAVEGTDGFDALARSYNYVVGRLWRTLLYQAVALVYGAITYLFVGAVIFATLVATHRFVGWGVMATTGDDGQTNRFDAIMPAPGVGNLAYMPDFAALDFSGKAAAVLVMVWSYLLIALVAAYAISFYFSVSTHIYLLLRRAADGTEFDDVYIDPVEEQLVAPHPPAAPEKVEPTGDSDSQKSGA